LFLNVSIWELNCYKREGNHWKDKGTVTVKIFMLSNFDEQDKTQLLIKFVTKMIRCSPMIGRFFDAMIVASSVKEWL